MNIWEYGMQAYRIAEVHGFHERHVAFENDEDVPQILAWLMLVSTEVAEAAEAVRNGDEANFTEELADICIRVFDYAFALGINLQAAIEAKMTKNEARAFRHGGKRA